LSAAGAQFVAADRAALSSPAYCLARGNSPSHIALAQTMCGPGEGLQEFSGPLCRPGRQRHGHRRRRRPWSGTISGGNGGGRSGCAAIAVKVSAVSDPCSAAVKVGLGSTWAEPRCHTNVRNRRVLAVAVRPRKVGSLNRQRPFRPGDGSRSSCPRPCENRMPCQITKYQAWRPVVRQIIVAEPAV
jgi:hypothetical protein